MKSTCAPCRLCVAILVVTLGLAAPLAAAPQAPEMSAVELDGVTYVSSDGARAEIVLDAARAVYVPERGVVELEEVDLRIEGNKSTAGLELTCKRGDLDLESGDFVAKGEVRGRTGAGRRFETEEVVYSHENSVVRTDQRVVIRDKDGTMTGRGFRYDTAGGRFQLMGASVVQQ